MEVDTAMSVNELCTEKEKKSINDAIAPFTLAVPQADLEDLNRRIDQTRWPDAETVDDWTQGDPLAKVKALVDHWRRRYDWGRCEAMRNNWGQYNTTIDGLGIHFLHVRSKHENALPLIITHGWPGSGFSRAMIGAVTVKRKEESHDRPYLSPSL